MKKPFLALTVVVGVVVAFFMFQTTWRSLANKAPSASPPPTPSQPQPSIPTLSYPLGWTSAPESHTTSTDMYDVTLPNGQHIALSVIRVPAWLAGPEEDEGYVIPHEQRPDILEMLKTVYRDSRLTPATQTAFLAHAGEFFGYSKNHRSALRYVETADRSFRGLSFFNQQGQAPGAFPIYYITLYSPERNLIMAATYEIPPNAPEIVEANSGIVRLMTTNAPQAAALQAADQEAHRAVTRILEQSSKKQLSFGSTLEDIDTFFTRLVIP